MTNISRPSRAKETDLPAAAFALILTLVNIAGETTGGPPC
jgi:hypothetical protein